MLLATRDKAIYPLLGTTYQKCKENELNLGLDCRVARVNNGLSLEGLDQDQDSVHFFTLL